MCSDPNAYLVIDDTVLDKHHARSIELTRRQYSGNEHRVIRGIGLVSCLYVNSQTGQFWVIDYRLYDKERDGQSKLEHVAEMLNEAVEVKWLSFRTVLMDGWYASQTLMAQIDQLGKVYYCPLKRNRRVDDSGAIRPYQRIDQLDGSDEDLPHGQLIKIRGFPRDKKVRLFRVTVSSHRTEFVATNDLSQSSTDAAHQESGIRWKIEEFHRELKQLTGVEACQCHKGRIQCNHIACALLAWARFKTLAYCSGVRVYRLKHRMFLQFLIA
ncbi:MAG: transposase [Cyanobacteria bacterium P01_E01_bin.34]